MFSYLIKTKIYILFLKNYWLLSIYMNIKYYIYNYYIYLKNKLLKKILKVIRAYFFLIL